MSRYLNSVPQIIDGNGDPIAGAKKAMYTPGTTNLKTIYSDSALATPRTNPVTSDADGRFPEFFLDGLYDEVQQDASGTVDTDDGVTIWTRDDVGDVSTGPFELWDSGTIYSIPQIVLGSDDEYYRSLIDSNQGNDPTSSATQWEQLQFGRIWNTNITYAIGESVYGSDGHLYIALVSQSGNDPTTSPTNWTDDVRKVLIESQTASASSSLDFATGIDSTYSVYEVEFINILPSTGPDTLYFRISDDTGSTWKSGASDYRYGNQANGTGAVSNAAAQILMTATAMSSTAASGGINGTARIYSPAASGASTQIGGLFSYADSTNFVNYGISGAYIAAATTDGFRFIFSTQTIASGTINLYGIK